MNRITPASRWPLNPEWRIVRADSEIAFVSAMRKIMGHNRDLDIIAERAYRYKYEAENELLSHERKLKMSVSVDEALLAVEHGPGDCACGFCVEARNVAARKLAAEVRRLRDIIGMTVDGVLVSDCKQLFCPRCGQAVWVCINRAYCDACDMRQGAIAFSELELFGDTPIGLALEACFSSGEAVKKSLEEKQLRKT